MDEYQDLEKECSDCKLTYTLTAGEQRFFASKTDDTGRPFQLPKRCSPCRKRKTAEKRREQEMADGGY